jgi:hypothetical protein
MRWNWKSAVVSSACRAALFFLLNLSSGLGAALAAMQVEFVYRAIAAGWYGALTEAFARRTSGWRANAIALVVVPGIAHSIEFTIHWIAGTPELGRSVAGSVAFSAVTTAFNLFAMRRGALTVGPGSQSLAADLVSIVDMGVAAVRSIRWRFARFT